MLVVFDFEKELYESFNVPVSFVGHPLLDSVKPTKLKENILSELKLNKNTPILTLLPGSRKREVKSLLGVMLKSCCILNKDFPGLQVLILRSPTVKEKIFFHILKKYPEVRAKIITGKNYDCLSVADFALVASGTATLETGIIGTPMAILYKISWLTWFYLSHAVKIPYIGLVNVVKRKKCVEEFIQHNAKPSLVASYVKEILSSPEKISAIRTELSEIPSLLGKNGASQRAARIIVDLIK